MKKPLLARLEVPQLLCPLSVPVWAPSSRIRHRETGICHHRNPCTCFFGALLLSFHSMRRLALHTCTKVSGPLSRKQNNSAWKATGFGQNEAVKPHRGSTPRYIKLFPVMLFFQALCLTSQDSVKANCCSSLQIQVLSYLSKLYGAQLVLSALFF